MIITKVVKALVKIIILPVNMVIWIAKGFVGAFESVIDNLKDVFSNKD